MGRMILPEVEAILDKEFPVLDHGFVRLVDYMGSDEAIVQAARVSYGKGTKQISQDRSLIRYLMRHNHSSPFEMVEMKWHCKMPIFVARQWIRHRTANVNEYSLRYSEPVQDFYIPNSGEVRFQSVTNKQGSEETEVPSKVAEKVIDFITSISESSSEKYEEMRKDNIARELARIGLPINLYTQWYWKNDLHNTLHFLGLRLDSNAQYEIQQYAQSMSHVIKKIAPFAYEAFEDYQLNAAKFSALELQILRDVINGKDLNKSANHWIENKREKGEFYHKWDGLMRT